MNRMASLVALLRTKGHAFSGDIMGLTRRILSALGRQRKSSCGTDRTSPDVWADSFLFQPLTTEQVDEMTFAWEQQQQPEPHQVPRYQGIHRRPPWYRAMPGKRQVSLAPLTARDITHMVILWVALTAIVALSVFVITKAYDAGHVPNTSTFRWSHGCLVSR